MIFLVGDVAELLIVGVLDEIGTRFLHCAGDWTRVIYNMRI
jgi:hypothetical protein